MDSLVLDTVVGVVFVFAVFALAVSALVEGVARWLGLRAEFLLRGLSSLLNSNTRFTRGWWGSNAGVRASSDPSINVVELMRTPIVDLTEALRVPEGQKLRRKDKRALPSYMSSRTFSRALINLLVPEPVGGQTTIDQLQDRIALIEDSRLREVLAGHLDNAERTVEAFRLEVERWYDTHMERVSGWYKRHTRKFTLGIAAALAVLFNVNAVTMAQALYSDQALRESVVALAFEKADCAAAESGGSAEAGDGQKDAAGKTPEECLNAVRGEIGGLRGAGLPVGWSKVPECAVPNAGCSMLDRLGVTVPDDAPWDDSLRVIVVLIGWALMVFAAFLGARFWFDALSRLNTLRSAGKKPAATV